MLQRKSVTSLGSLLACHQFVSVRNESAVAKDTVKAVFEHSFFTQQKGNCVITIIILKKLGCYVKTKCMHLQISWVHIWMTTQYRKNIKRLNKENAFKKNLAHFEFDCNRSVTWSKDGEWFTNRQKNESANCGTISIPQNVEKSVCAMDKAENHMKLRQHYI